MHKPARRTAGLLAALGLVALPLPSAGAASPAPQAVFVLDGKGHGHGVGMAQDSANAMAAAGQSHEQILDLFYPGTKRSVRRSAIRVAVWEAGAPAGTVTVSTSGGATVSGSAGSREVPAGTVLQVSTDGSGFSVRAAAPARGSAVRAGLLEEEPSPSPSESAEPGLLPTPTSPPESAAPTSAASPGPSSSRPASKPSPKPAGKPPARATPSPSPSPAGFSYDSSGPVTLSPRGGLLTVVTTGRTYRGSLVALSQSGYRLVNVLDVEEYLLGLGEVPAGWPLAALRTQAVAARTYALRAVGAGRPLGYDVCDDTRCQVYLGVQGERARTGQATRDTRGQVVTYRGALADTFYSANAGGVTASPGEGFGGTSTSPYLPAGTKAPGEVDPWKVTATPAEIAARLGYRGSLTGITIAKKGPSGRAVLVRLDGSAGPMELGGVVFQRRLGLRSNLLTVRRGTGTAQGLPAASAAVAQLAPAQAATAPVLPEPSAAPSASPEPPPDIATPAPVQARAAEGSGWAVPAAAGLLALAGAGAAVVVRRRPRPQVAAGEPDPIEPVEPEQP
jgi:SpoIID/LytB domain protein